MMRECDIQLWLVAMVAMLVMVVMVVMLVMVVMGVVLVMVVNGDGGDGGSGSLFVGLPQFSPCSAQSGSPKDLVSRFCWNHFKLRLTKV